MAKVLPRQLILASAFFLLWTGTAITAQIVTQQPLVVIDPGHGKDAPGQISESGTQESALTMALARKLAQALSGTCRVMLTHSPDNDTAPASRVALANHAKADLYLSLHLSGHLSSGPLIYYFDLPEAPAADTWQTRSLKTQPLSRQLAQTLAMACTSDRPDEKPVLFSAPAIPLEGLSMPGLMIEPFAISKIFESPEKREAYLSQWAGTLASAIQSYLADR